MTPLGSVPLVMRGASLASACALARARPARDAEDAQGAVPAGPRADVDHRDVADRTSSRRRRSIVDGPGGDAHAGRRRRARIAEARSTASQPSSRYRYRVEVGGADAGTASSRPRRRVGTDVPFSFVVFGDTPLAASSTHRRVVERMSQEVPDFVLGTGDMVDEGSRQDQWQQFFDVENALLRDNVYFPALGNHDRQGRGRTADTYRAYFSVPENGADTERYYAFTLRQRRAS